MLMLGCMFPKYCSITAKSSLKYTPFIGQFSKTAPDKGKRRRRLTWNFQ